MIYKGLEARVEAGIFSQENLMVQVKPPRTSGDGLYSNISESMMSMIGTTIDENFSLVRSSRGSSQCLFTSMWLSRKTSTWMKGSS